MTMTTLAVYENGKLRPIQSLPLAEGETVQLTVTRSRPGQLFSVKEAERGMRSAKTLSELFSAYEKGPRVEDGYDLLKALDENRQGERPLFPPELKGVTW